MIIDWDTDSLHYEKQVKKERKLNYKCPICKQKSTLVRHGFYRRNIVLWLGRAVEQELVLLRLRCKACKCTHAVLPRDVIPYRIYCLSFYWKLIRILYQLHHQVSLCTVILHTYHNQVYQVIDEVHKLTRKPKSCVRRFMRFYSLYMIPKKKLRQFTRYTT